MSKTCTLLSCSWVTKPFSSPRECLIVRDDYGSGIGKEVPRAAKVFGMDSGNCPIVCDGGDHPLLSLTDWRYVESNQ